MRTFCCVIIITLFFTCAPAQELMSRSQPDAALPGTTSLTIHRLVPEVQMVISAQDHRHRPVVDLQEAEIAVFDNGIAVPITSFESRASLPLRIALLLDASESMHPGFAAERRTGLNSLRRLHGSRGDQVFAITFAAGQMPFLAYAQTEAPKASPPLQAGGQTALYDSLIAAARKLASATPTRRVLLLFSDGEDNYSRATLGEAIAALQQWQIAVYSISVHSSRWEYPGDRILRQIAASSGGRAFFLSRYDKAQAIFAEIESELRGQYVVGFRPAGQLNGGEFHAVRIQGRSGHLRLRTRAGYYVPSAN